MHFPLASFLAAGATAQKASAAWKSSSFSQIYISHEVLFQQDALFMQKKDAPVLKAAVQTFRDVLWASHVAGGLWYHPALSLGVQSIFLFHPGSGSVEYLGDALLSP